MIILILLGLIQALVLPGLICSYWIKNIDYRDRIILTSTLSLLLNYTIVWFLYALNIYSQQSMFILLGIEFVLILKISRYIAEDFKNFYQHALTTLKTIIRTKTINIQTLLFVLFCLYYFYLLKTSGFLTVFTHWDAVVSWNRWAVELHEGTFQGSRGYPQAISILFSIVYTIANETNIQTLVKYICVYWPFLGGVAIFNCGIYLPKFKNVFGVAAIFYLYLISKGSWTIDFIFSGLADPFMAAFGAIFVFSALLIFSPITRKHPQFNKIIALTSLSIGTSALIKMTGVFLFFYFIFILFIFFVIHKSNFKIHRAFYITSLVISTLLVLHWYVFTTFYWHDWQPISEYNSLQDPRIWIRPYFHGVLFNFNFGWLFTLLVFTGVFLSLKLFVIFLIFISPIFLFCSITVGYDLRATFILFAPLSILAAFGLFNFYHYLIKLFIKINRLLNSSHLLSMYGPLLIALIVLIPLLVGLTHIMPDDKILFSNTEKRIAANDFADNGNRRLIKIFENEPDARIISCWQTPFGLPGAQGRFIPTGNCTITLMQGWLADKNIKYWLYRDEKNSSQALNPEFVNEYLSRQPVQIQSESLGSGFVLYSKTKSSNKTN